MKIETLKIGTILKSSWNGMSDFYEIVKITPKSVVLREILWQTCEPPEGEENDPVHRWTKIVRDENGKPVYDPEYFTGKEKLCRKLYVKNDESWNLVRSPNYNGEGSVSVLESDYTLMFWD